MKNPKVALALSLMMPGLGHIYNGEFAKGLSLFLIFAFTIPLFAWIGIHIASALWLIVLLGTGLALALYITCIVNSYKAAKRSDDIYQSESPHAAYMYVALLFFGYFFVLTQLSNYTLSHVTEIFRIPSSSMIPNILPGDRFLADKRVNSLWSGRRIKRGDVGLIIYPNDRTMIFAKRIIGLPGDKIDIADQHVSVNGRSITETAITELGSTELDLQLPNHFAFIEKSDSGSTYAVLWKKGSAQAPLSVSIPNGYVYVLGDNRDDSVDSRTFGPVPLTDVIGVARQILFSSSSDAGVRLSRIGKTLDVN